MCVPYHKFYCGLSCCLPQNYPGLKWLNSSVNLTKVAQWLRLALSKRPNWVGVFSLPLHLRTETDPISETSCFYSQEHRTMEKVQNSVCYASSSEPFKIYLHSSCFERTRHWSYDVSSEIFESQRERGSNLSVTPLLFKHALMGLMWRKVTLLFSVFFCENLLIFFV
jgi:hypothetical protein